MHHHTTNVSFEAASLDIDPLLAADAVVKRDPKNPDVELLPERSKVAARDSLTPHTLFASEACFTKGQLYVNPKNPPIGLSSFTSQFVQDGKDFETKLEADPALWTHKFNQASGYALASSVPRTNIGKAYLGKDAFSPEIQTAIINTLRDASKQPTPIIFFQIPLTISEAQCLQIFGSTKTARGIMDIAIWTGHTWVLGEIKRTENTLVQYCMQTEFYCRVLMALLPATTIHSHTFVITCSPGFTYSKWETKDRNLLALKNINIEMVERASIAFRLDQALIKLLKPNQRVHNDPFQPKCIECEFRSICYTRQICGPTTDIGLMSFNESTVRRLKLAGIHTVEELLLRGKHDQLVQDICFGELSTELWLKRAKITKAIGGYSAWRPKSDWLDDFWVACAPKEDSNSASKLEWWMPCGNYPLIPPPPYPKVVFTYTFAEKRRVLAQFYAARSTGVADKIPQVVPIQDELRRKVRFPYTAFTLNSICRMLEAIAKGEHSRDVIVRWLPEVAKSLSDKTKLVPDAPPYPSRPETLAAIVRSLIPISQICQEETDASII